MLQPVKIDMRDGNADQWRVIGLDDSEAGAWCFFLQTQARKQAPRQRRFACPQPAPQGNDVARLHHFGKPRAKGDRKRVVEGKSVSVRVDLGGLRSIKKKRESTRERHGLESTLID